MHHCWSWSFLQSEGGAADWIGRPWDVNKVCNWPCMKLSCCCNVSTLVWSCCNCWANRRWWRITLCRIASWVVSLELSLIQSRKQQPKQDWKTCEKSQDKTAANWNGKWRSGRMAQDNAGRRSESTTMSRSATSLHEAVNKISWGMPLETKMPTCKIDVTLIRTDPCQEQHVTLKHQKFHTDKNRRLLSSRRHRFCTWHHITGHFVLNKKKKVCCSNRRVPSYATRSARKFRGWYFQVTQKVFEHQVFKDRET